MLCGCAGLSCCIRFVLIFSSSRVTPGGSEVAGMGLDPYYLRRKYLSKLPEELRRTIMTKPWSLDGPD